MCVGNETSGSTKSTPPIISPNPLTPLSSELKTKIDLWFLGMEKRDQEN